MTHLLENPHTKSEYLTVAIADNVAQITITRARRKNALNTALVVELATVLAQLFSEKSAHAVVIHGEDGNFAAGADIDEIAELSPAQALTDARVAAWASIRQCPLPLIAAVEGYCLGGGLELLLSCDFAFADERATFGLPEVTLGIMPGAGGTQILPRVIGKARAAQMVYSGKLFSAAQMMQWQLLNEIIGAQDELSVLDYALKEAKRIARNAPFAVQQAKRSLLQSQAVGLEDGLKFERQAFSMLSATIDKQEGIQAFKDKRRAQFTGE